MISLRGVAVHNLKNIDIDLPKGKLIVFCGRSGSGKSSLALDTLYAEGQRQYIETFSPAIRRFLEKVEKPKAESLEGIPPAIAVGAFSRPSGSLTVGEATELRHYLASLFVQVGHVFCPECSRPITSDTPQTVWQQLRDAIQEGTKLQIVFTPPLEETSGKFADIWKEQGFLRGCFADAGRTEYDRRLISFRLDEPIPAKLYQPGLFIVADRLIFNPNNEERFIESLETAFDYGEGKCSVLLDNGVFHFSRTLSCGYCDVHVPRLTPKLLYTDWSDHIHFFNDVRSPTLSGLYRLTISELIQFFDSL